MKKIIASCLLCVLLVLSSLPVSATLADKQNFSIYTDSEKLEVIPYSQYRQHFSKQDPNFTTVQSLALEAERESRIDYYTDKVNFLNQKYHTNYTLDEFLSLVNEYNLEDPRAFDSDNIYVVQSSDPKAVIIEPYLVQYYTSDTRFEVRLRGVDLPNPVDMISGSAQLHFLNQRSWRDGEEKTFSKSNIPNGNSTVFSWNKGKNYVEEYFTCKIKISDNGLSQSLNNLSDDQVIRTNYEAGAYNKLPANGGQRHHLIPKTSLDRAGFNSNSAYVMRMNAADHTKTASYGNSSYVAQITEMLLSKQYKQAIDKEVSELRSRKSADGKYSLYAKYYDPAYICVREYKRLFGI